MKIAGLDIGTTGCKCTVFDERGKYLDHAYQDYPVKRSMSGHEIDMWVLRDAVLHVVSEMAFRYPDIMGLGVTSFGESFGCRYALYRPKRERRVSGTDRKARRYAHC